MSHTRNKTTEKPAKRATVATVIPPEEEKKYESHATKRLNPQDLYALENLKKYYEKETEKCVKLVGNNTLTVQEYMHATLEFKSLIEIPYKKNEPIYIMP
jgi:hypothetical protein